MTPTCINLRERFGDAYRIRHEESYAAERSEFRAAEEPWLQIIPCRHGHIYPHGGNLLAVSTDRRGIMARRLMALGCLTVAQDGSDGINATFPVEAFDQVAAIVRPKRRRRLTPEHRAAATERLRRFQFSAARKRGSDELERAQTPSDDLGAIETSDAILCD
jgi:hypothetical protein